jgi:long-chain acyl-CoA synthetase
VPTDAALDIPQLLAGLPERIGHVIRPHAHARPDHPALVDHATSWSYGRLLSIVTGLASTLRDLDVRPGDRIMIVSENSLPLAALVLAASEIDAWAVVVNPRLTPRELDQIRDHAQPRRIFYVTAVSLGAQDHADRHDAPTQTLLGLGTLAVGSVNPFAEQEPVHASGAEQVAALMYTSGTTGVPKGVMLTHRNLLFNAKVSGELRNLSPADQMYGVLPMSHIVGLSNILISFLMFGATIQVVPRYDPADLARAIADDDISLLFGVPATFQRLLEYKATAGLASLPRGRLRYLGVAGAPLDGTLKARIEQEFGLPLMNGYGITECGPAISGVRLSAPRNDTGIGAPIPGVDVRIVGRGGASLVNSEIGELHARGPGVMRGYYRAPELTRAAIDAEGWFNTGDLVQFKDGSLFIAGRTKEMIIRSGFNVYPAEVEGVLNAHPAVVQSAVVGRPVDGNEEVVAFVQLLPGAAATTDDLRRYAAEQLTAYKRPSTIVCLEVLPSSSTGKILKHQLAEAARQFS